MSRKGKQPVDLPNNVQVEIKPGLVVVKGPKGTLQQMLPEGVILAKEESQLLVSVEGTSKQMKSFHGLYRSLIQNMVTGTSTGFQKELELVGVGYRATVQGKELDLQLGFSHPTRVGIPDDLAIKVEKNSIVVSGIDKQKVGEYCAQLRRLRPPEPYQGKGVRYKNEYVRRKQGKASGKK